MAHLLVWVVARNRSTGDEETIGFWTGDDHREFTISGQARTYLAAGSLLKVQPIVGEVGVRVRTTRLTFSGASPEFKQAVAQYETNDAPCRFHVADFYADTHQLVAEPQRRYKGFIKGIDYPRPALSSDGQPGFSEAEVSVQSAARVLTRSLPLKKSDEALQGRHANDRFRRYIDVSGSVETVWGENRGTR
ncbi:MAG: hypothetical protein AAGL96_17980 [Pseudomonadota bacterium]